MPLFHYTCNACGQQSELLIRSSETPACPACGSDKLDKQASHFAAVRGSEAPMPSCASGACGMDMGGGACGLEGGGCCLN
ncbi:MAG: FmdB family zinc ribbon protein [Candidatus Hydrogenedentota bacterium]